MSEGTRRGMGQRRRRRRVQLRDVEAFRREGLVAESMRPLAALAESEAHAILADLGGVEVVSEMEKALVEDLCRVGVVLRAELARYLATGDRDAGSRCGTLASVRRASLTALGLRRRERVLDLEAYLAQREEREAEEEGNSP